MLVALLKRRETTAGALVKTKHQAQELRAQLRPLREELQQLELKRACLDEKLHLIALQRREHVGRYKVTLESKAAFRVAIDKDVLRCGASLPGGGVSSGGAQQRAEDRAGGSEEKKQRDGGAEGKPHKAASSSQVSNKLYTKL